MKHKKYPEEYQATKIRPIVQIAARMVQNNPAIADDMDYLWANLVRAVPGLEDKSKCGGCGRSMKISIYEADLLDALLILAMARAVRENLKTDASFTNSNKVHIPTLGATQGILKRQTKCDYLGLIKQPENWKGSGYWLLTSWAWAALRGEKIPKAVKYWEGNLLGRSEATTTLSEMFKNHADLVQMQLAKRGAVKVNYKAHFEDYDPADWKSTHE